MQALWLRANSKVYCCHPGCDDQLVHRALEKKLKTRQAMKHSLYQIRKRSHPGPLGPRHHMTPPPAKKTKEVSGKQENDLQYLTPGLNDDLLQKFSQEHVAYCSEWA